MLAIAALSLKDTDNATVQGSFGQEGESAKDAAGKSNLMGEKFEIGRIFGRYGSTKTAEIAKSGINSNRFGVPDVAFSFNSTGCPTLSSDS